MGLLEYANRQLLANGVLFDAQASRTDGKTHPVRCCAQIVRHAEGKNVVVIDDNLRLAATRKSYCERYVSISLTLYGFIAVGTSCKLSVNINCNLLFLSVDLFLSNFFFVPLPVSALKAVSSC